MRTARLTTSESLMLDIIRVSASLVVAYGHITQPYFSTGWRDRTFAAQSAVVVFFVLSGFVIRYVTTGRPTTLGNYASDRASRIYSVAIPALLFTLAADSISRHINPQFYLTLGNNFAHPLRRIFVNLIFCGQVWDFRTTPLSNTPYWSINYEVAYYIIYGLYYYVTGRLRWPLVIAACLFFGYHVLLLFPLWIAGCVLHDIYRDWDGFLASNFFRRARLIVFPLAAMAAAVPFVPLKRLLHITPAMADFAHQQQIGLGNYLFGLVVIPVFPLLLRLARRVKPKSSTVNAIRFIAEGTFPIYLFHFPMYALIAACVPYNHASAAAKLGMFATAVILGILLGHPCNKLKLALRSLFTPQEKLQAGSAEAA